MHVWSAVNHSLNVAFDFYLWPFRSLPASWQACALAIPAAALALIVYRFTSDQTRIQNTKDRIKAHLLEFLLFKDDLGVILRAQGRILKYSLTYTRLALVPMAVMILPFILFLIQIESRFAFRSLEPGEAAILSITFDDTESVNGLTASLSPPAGLTQETPSLRVDSTKEIFWRIGAVTPGEYQIGIAVGEAVVEMPVLVGNYERPVSPAVYRENDIRTLAYPAEPALKGNIGARVIRLEYPRARASFVGLSSASWIFFGMTLLFGFALRGLFKVTF